MHNRRYVIYIYAICFELISHLQVFDRLEPVGICLSYCCTERVIDGIRVDFDKSVVEAVKEGKTIRLVGDNVNLSVGVRDERSNRHGKMLNYFGSAVLIHKFQFPTASHDEPQRDYRALKPADLLPSTNDVECLIEDYVHMTMHIAVKHIAYFSYLKDMIPRYLVDDEMHQLKQKTEVIPLSVLPKNEQKYGEVVDILRYYETMIANVYQKAGKDMDNIKIHIGGDQLTRETSVGQN